MTHTHRLIIDRSILLLLSTSKCCLRRLSSDCLHKLEARRQSILVQIRASISAILAIVKCSVFSPSLSLSLPLSRSNTDDDDVDHHRSTSPKSAAAAALFACTSPSLPLSGACFDEEVLRRQSAGSQPDVFASRRRLEAAAVAAVDYEEEDYYLALNDHHPLNSRRPTPCQTRAATTATKLGAGGGGARRVVAANKQPLQIMNYFLQTWSGTQSAHNAINNLQVSCCAPHLSFKPRAAAAAAS